MLAGRAQGSHTSSHLPSVQRPFSDTRNPWVHVIPSYTKILPTPLKKMQPSNFVCTYREGTYCPCVPSGCQCHGVREGQLEFEMHGTLDRKASSCESPSKRAITISHHVFSLVPDNPLEALRCWFSAMPNTHSAAELKGRWASNVHLSKSTSHQVIQGPHRKQQQQKKNATTAKWMLRRKPVSKYFQSPDHEFASRALYSLHFYLV